MISAQVGFATGARADAIAALGAPAAARGLLDQLDAMFGGRCATAACCGTAMADWGAEPEFHGGYTYPSPGCLPLRAALREPVERVFFCGEHCTEGLDPCVQAALADGERAATAALGLLVTPPARELDRLSLEPPPPPPQRSESSPRQREIMAPGRSPARPPWTTPADASHRLPGGVDQDELPAFYH